MLAFARGPYMDSVSFPGSGHVGTNSETTFRVDDFGGD